jgi:multiple sugar transport system ATP-binding protein
MAAVRLQSVRKCFGSTVVVDDVTLQIDDLEFLVLVGPSGCGKSTTLRMIAGLEDVTSGDIFIGDRRVNDLGPKDRDIAMVFQNYALYPHMDVYANMAFGLQMRGVERAEIDRRVKEGADILDLGPLLKRKPKQLSGGQRQRAALGRAIVRNPAVFLMDEPLSNLDAKLRVQTRGEIVKLHQRVATTMIYVTHDRFLPCRLEAEGDALYVRGDGFSVQVPDTRRAGLANADRAAMTLGVRPEDIAIHGDGTIPAVVDIVEPLGPENVVYLRCGSERITARTPPDTAIAGGDNVRLGINAARMHLFDAASGNAYV